MLKKITHLFFLATVCMGMLNSVSAQNNDTLRHYDLWSTSDFPESPMESSGNDPWGFRFGIGSNGLSQFAEKYYIDGAGKVEGVLVYLMGTNGGLNGANSSKPVWYYVYNSNGSPTSPIDSVEASINSLSVSGFVENVGEFTSPVSVSDSFFVGFGYKEYVYIKTSPKYTTPPDTFGVMVTPNRNEDPKNKLIGRNYVKVSRKYNKLHWITPENYFTGEYRNFLISPIINLNSTSIEKNGLKINSVYPNPVVNTTNVNFNLKTASKVVIRIHTMEGKTLLENDLGTVNAGNFTHNIDLGSLGSGNYVISVFTGSALITGKIVKL